jgi:hypothetical protein
MGGPSHSPFPPHQAVRTRPSDRTNHERLSGYQSCAICHDIRRSNHLDTRLVTREEYDRIYALDYAQRTELAAQDARVLDRNAGLGER